ncbi:MAG: hypothetical protein NZM07_08650 [Elioraea sp.]|nr:hypothetical protein [Elioraea sp.]
MQAARALALRWMGSLALPPIKAVALDLDGTLHHGVLGEDGVAGVRVSAARDSLQDGLFPPRERGALLAVVSRNDPADVLDLFRTRTDYQLRAELLSAIEAS